MAHGLLKRLAGLLDAADRWLADTFAGAIEADLRDAGYEVLGRASDATTRLRTAAALP